MLFKKYFFTSLISIFVSFLLLGAGVMYLLVISHNPLQIHPQGYFDIAKYHKDMRLQARGIIENVDFDSVILGNSVTENSSASEASKLFDARFINISMSGANFYERAIILKYLFAHKKVKKVIYPVSFRDVFLFEGTKALNKWELLYDTNTWNDFDVMYEKKIISLFAQSSFKKEQKVYTNLTFFDRPEAWYTFPASYKKFGGLQNWVNSIDEELFHTFFLQRVPEAAAKVSRPLAVLQPSERVQKNIAILNTYLLTYVKKHPETQFYFILPPYYRYKYAELRQLYPNKFFAHQEAIRYLVRFSQQYKNLQVYGFEDQAFVDDITRYKDIGHFDEKINSYLTHSLAQKKHLLTPENVEHYLERCHELAVAFDIVAFNNAAQKLLKLQQKKSF